MDIRLSGRAFNSLVNGKGLRYVVFSQGCRHNCKGCFSPFTHSFDGGELFNVDTIANEILSDPITKGVTFSGGDPFEQAGAFAVISAIIKSNSTKDIWCYTGYTFEEIEEGINNGKIDWALLLPFIDVLVDGKFEEGNKCEGLTFKGSKNQRLIDVQESLKQNKVIIINEV